MVTTGQVHLATSASVLSREALQKPGLLRPTWPFFEAEIKAQKLSLAPLYLLQPESPLLASIWPGLNEKHLCLGCRETVRV